MIHLRTNKIRQCLHFCKIQELYHTAHPQCSQRHLKRYSTIKYLGIAYINMSHLMSQEVVLSLKLILKYSGASHNERTV